MNLIARAAALAALLHLTVSPALAQGETATAPPAAAPDLSRLTAEHRADLACAAAFAIVASEQARGVESALAFPPLGQRGKDYFVAVSTGVMADAGLTREAVRDLLLAEVAAMQARAVASNQPAAVLAAAMPACLTRLEARVPPLAKPTLLQCTAILSLAYQEVYSREGLSPTARDLKTLASVLAAREREALTALGRTGDEADRTLAAEHDRMLEEALTAGGVTKYDIETCFDFAKPDPAEHY